MPAAPMGPHGWLRLAVISLASCCLALFFAATKAGTGLQHSLYDWISTARPTQPSQQIVLVVADNSARNRIHEPVALWSKHYAEALRRVASAKPRAIGFDLLFNISPEQDPGGDLQMAQAYLEASAAVPVILGFDRTAGIPQTRLGMAASTYGAVGFINSVPDSDDFIRRHRPCVVASGIELYSFAVKLAEHATDMDIRCPQGVFNWGRVLPSLDDEQLLWLHSGAAPNSYPRVSLPDVLEKSTDARELERHFAGKIVIFGELNATDLHATPAYARTGERTPGIEIHAQAVEALIAKTWYRPLGSNWTILVTLLLAFAAGTIIVRLRWRSGLPVATLIVAIAIAGWMWLVSKGIWLPPIAPLSAMAFSFTGNVLGRYLSERRSRILVRLWLGRYVSEEIVNYVLDSANEVQRGKLQNVTVLSADVRGFTTIAEHLSPVPLVEQLNEYLSTMTDVVVRHGGHVDKFIGDGILAVFGAPKPGPHDAGNAVDAALSMLEALGKLNIKWARENRPTWRIGIGIHSGPAVLGNIGSEKKMEYTVIGDTVNVASRVEGETKHLPKHAVSILLTQQTVDELRRSAQEVDVTAVHIGSLRGRSGVVKLYKLGSSAVSAGGSE